MTRNPCDAPGCTASRPPMSEWWSVRQDMRVWCFCSFPCLVAWVSQPRLFEEGA